MLRQMLEQVEDEKMCTMIEDFNRWFYSLTDAIAVTSEAGADMLGMKGYDRGKIFVCRGGAYTPPRTFPATPVPCNPLREPAFLHNPA